MPAAPSSTSSSPTDRARRQEPLAAPEAAPAARRACRGRRVPPGAATRRAQHLQFVPGPSGRAARGACQRVDTLFFSFLPPVSRGRGAPPIPPAPSNFPDCFARAEGGPTFCARLVFGDSFFSFVAAGPLPVRRRGCRDLPAPLILFCPWPAPILQPCNAWLHPTVESPCTCMPHAPPHPPAHVCPQPSLHHLHLFRGLILDQHVLSHAHLTPQMLLPQPPSQALLPCLHTVHLS